METAGYVTYKVKSVQSMNLSKIKIQAIALNIMMIFFSRISIRFFKIVRFYRGYLREQKGLTYMFLYKCRFRKIAHNLCFKLLLKVHEHSDCL